MITLHESSQKNEENIHLDKYKMSLVIENVILLIDLFD